MGIKLITAPASEPLTLAGVKDQLRIDGTDSDARITSLISEARSEAESLTGHALLPQTWELALDDFKDTIYLQKPPLVSVLSVKYIDSNGVLQTVANADYIVDNYSQPARLTPAYGKKWPSARVQANSVLIRFTSGYASADDVPENIKSWMKLYVESAYDAHDMPEHATRLLSSYIDYGK